jgi:hypothetical protein
VVVEPRRIELRSLRCEGSVFPLDDGPTSIRSGRQESNLRGPGSGPGGQPLTHTLIASLGDRRGSNPHLRVHSAPCSTTTPRPPSVPVVPGARFERAFAVSETAVLPVRRSGKE